MTDKTQTIDAGAQPAPALQPDALAEVSKEQYARMFDAACDALGQISDNLGIDSDINPGAEPIIEAIDELRAAALQAAPPAHAAMAVPDESVKKIMRLVDYFRGAAQFGCPEDMQVAREDIESSLRAALAAAPAQAQGVTIDFKQATALLEMFGSEPTEITLMTGDGHSGSGLYASYTDMPEEGAEFLGAPDDEAMPAAPAQEDARDADFEAVRKVLCKIPKYSFLMDTRGNLRRSEDASGNWVEFDAVHKLLDPVAVDAARAAQGGA